MIIKFTQRRFTMAEGQFDKDFGYLTPFLDKVTAAAESLSDPAAREELKRLMADEKSRWSRIRQLLSGASGQSQTVTKPVEANSVKTDSPAQAVSRTESFAITPSFTVGSLRPRPR
jgi:hypothetical protein